MTSSLLSQIISRQGSYAGVSVNWCWCSVHVLLTRQDMCDYVLFREKVKHNHHCC